MLSSCQTTKEDAKKKDNTSSMDEETTKSLLLLPLDWETFYKAIISTLEYKHVIRKRNQHPAMYGLSCKPMNKPCAYEPIHKEDEERSIETSIDDAYTSNEEESFDINYDSTTPSRTCADSSYSSVRHDRLQSSSTNNRSVNNSSNDLSIPSPTQTKKNVNLYFYQKHTSPILYQHNIQQHLSKKNGEEEEEEDNYLNNIKRVHKILHVHHLITTSNTETDILTSNRYAQVHISLLTQIEEYLNNTLNNTLQQHTVELQDTMQAYIALNDDAKYKITTNSDKKSRISSERKNFVRIQHTRVRTQESRLQQCVTQVQQIQYVYACLRKINAQQQIYMKSIYLPRRTTHNAKRKEVVYAVDVLARMVLYAQGGTVRRLAILTSLFKTSISMTSTACVPHLTPWQIWGFYSTVLYCTHTVLRTHEQVIWSYIPSHSIPLRTFLYTLYTTVLQPSAACSTLQARYNAMRRTYIIPRYKPELHPRTRYILHGIALCKVPDWHARSRMTRNQHHYRGMSRRFESVEYKREVLCVICIQSTWRGYSVRWKLLCHVKALATADGRVSDGTPMIVPTYDSHRKNGCDFDNSMSEDQETKANHDEEEEWSFVKLDDVIAQFCTHLRDVGYHLNTVSTTSIVNKSNNNTSSTTSDINSSINYRTSSSTNSIPSTNAASSTRDWNTEYHNFSSAHSRGTVLLQYLHHCNTLASSTGIQYLPPILHKRVAHEVRHAMRVLSGTSVGSKRSMLSVPLYTQVYYAGGCMLYKNGTPVVLKGEDLDLEGYWRSVYPSENERTMLLVSCCRDALPIPTLPSTPKVESCLYRMFRPEYIQMQAYSKHILFDPMCNIYTGGAIRMLTSSHTEQTLTLNRTATQVLYTQRIPECAAYINSTYPRVLLQCYASADVIPPLDFGNSCHAPNEVKVNDEHLFIPSCTISQVIHTYGINMRHLLILRAHCDKPSMQVMLLSEACARCIKWILRGVLRRCDKPMLQAECTWYILQLTQGCSYSRTLVTDAKSGTARNQMQMASCTFYRTIVHPLLRYFSTIPPVPAHVLYDAIDTRYITARVCHMLGVMPTPQSQSVKFLPVCKPSGSSTWEVAYVHASHHAAQCLVKLRPYPHPIPYVNKGDRIPLQDCVVEVYARPKTFAMGYGARSRSVVAVCTWCNPQQEEEAMCGTLYIHHSHNSNVNSSDTNTNTTASASTAQWRFTLKPKSSPSTSYQYRKDNKTQQHLTLQGPSVNYDDTSSTHMAICLHSGTTKSTVRVVWYGNGRYWDDGMLLIPFTDLLYDATLCTWNASSMITASLHSTRVKCPVNKSLTTGDTDLYIYTPSWQENVARYYTRTHNNPTTSIQEWMLHARYALQYYEIILDHLCCCSGNSDLLHTDVYPAYLKYLLQLLSHGAGVAFMRGTLQYVLTQHIWPMPLLLQLLRGIVKILNPVYEKRPNEQIENRAHVKEQVISQKHIESYVDFVLEICLFIEERLSHESNEGVIEYEEEYVDVLSTILLQFELVQHVHTHTTANSTRRVHVAHMLRRVLANLSYATIFHSRVNLHYVTQLQSDALVVLLVYQMILCSNVAISGHRNKQYDSCLRVIDLSEVSKELCAQDIATVCRNLMLQQQDSTSRNTIGGFTFRLCQCDNLTDEVLCEVVKILNVRLEQIDVKNCHALRGESTWEFCAISCPNLKEVDMEGCCYVKESDIIALLLSCSRKNGDGGIKSLNVQGCSVVTDAVLSAFATIRDPLHKTAEADDSITCNSIGAILNRQQQEMSLNVSYCCQITDSGIASLCETSRVYQQLTTLDVSYCSNISNIGLQGIAKCANLRSLKLNGLIYCTAVGIWPILENCTLLEVLQMSKCCLDLDFEGMLGRENKNNYATNLLSSPTSSSRVSRNPLLLPNLREMSVNGCCELHSLSWIGSTVCPHLETLDAGGITYLVDSSVIPSLHIPKSNIRRAFALSLRKLCLAGCSLLTDASIQYVLEYQENLELLDLSYCVRITDNAFSKILFEIAKCANVDHSNLLDAKSCNGAESNCVLKLRKLLLKKCHRVTNDGLKALQQVCENVIW